MPCGKCGKTVNKGNDNGCRVRYCICGLCNHCHITGLCPSGPYWYRQKGTRGRRSRFVSNSSHGGHGFIPGCRRQH